MTALEVTQKNYINNKYPRNDGGWIHYRVTDKEQLADAQTMLTILERSLQKCGMCRVRLT